MILETQRLILRPLTIADAETAFYGWTGDAEANKHVSWLPHHSFDDAIEWLVYIYAGVLFIWWQLKGGMA